MKDAMWLLETYIWVFPKIGGKPQKWMVYKRKPIGIDDLGVRLVLETPVYIAYSVQSWGLCLVRQGFSTDSQVL